VLLKCSGGLESINSPSSSLLFVSAKFILLHSACAFEVAYSRCELLVPSLPPKRFTILSAGILEVEVCADRPKPHDY
jgi:hypothetical protein